MLVAAWYKAWSAAARLRVCEFESRRRYGCLSLVSCVLSSIRHFDGRSLVQRGPAEYVCVCVCVSVNVIRYNSNPLHQQ
jgi:hypothetical protein